jgi:DNA-binding MarR family transcriptional regulator
LSVEAISWSLAQNAPSPTAKFVLVLLANLADDDGRCWPGIGYITDRTQLNRATIIRAIAALEDCGLLEKVIRPGEGDGRKSNLYQLAMSQRATKGQSRSVSRQCRTVRPNTKDTLKSIYIDFWQTNDITSQFAAFREMRRKQKAPLTDHAEKLLISKLKKLSAEGHDMAELLDAAILNGWKSVWPPRAESRMNGARPTKLNPADARPGESWEDFTKRMEQTR